MQARPLGSSLQEAIHDPTRHRPRNASEREEGAPPEVGRGVLFRLIGLTVARVIRSHLDKKPRIFTPSRCDRNSRCRTEVALTLSASCSTAKGDADAAQALSRSRVTASRTPAPST